MRRKHRWRRALCSTLMVDNVDQRASTVAFITAWASETRFPSTWSAADTHAFAEALVAKSDRIDATIKLKLQPLLIDWVRTLLLSHDESDIYSSPFAARQSYFAARQLMMAMAV